MGSVLLNVANISRADLNATCFSPLAAVHLNTWKKKNPNISVSHNSRKYTNIHIFADISSLQAVGNFMLALDAVTLALTSCLH